MSSNFKILMSLFLATFFFISCGKKDVRDYYFPLKQLQTLPKVYEYAFKTRDTSIRLYSYFQTIVQGDSINFVGTDYDGDFRIVLMRREEKLQNGMKLKDLTFFGTNTEGLSVEKKASVEGGAVFPFEVKDSNSVFINIIKYSDPKDSTKETTLTRNLRFLKTTTYNFKGQKYAALEFEMKEEQALKDNEKGGWSHVYKVQQIFAKGLGLVYTKRQVTDSEFVEMQLLDVYSMEELEKKFKEHLLIDN